MLSSPHDVIARVGSGRNGHFDDTGLRIIVDQVIYFGVAGGGVQTA